MDFIIYFNPNFLSVDVVFFKKGVPNLRQSLDVITFFLGHLDVGASVAGDFHLAADVALMETLSRALATGGRRVLRGLVKINSFGRHLKDQRNF